MNRFLASVLAPLLLLCASAAPVRADGAMLINGAGATFPYPLYSKWFAEYNRLRPSERFNYQSIGSGGGIKQITARTVDFGATDSPMTAEELAKAPGVLHVPTAIGAVVIVYSGAADGLRLSPEVLSDVFLGKITRWTDARIAQLNPGARLPDVPIIVVHRSDGSGTTGVFTDYLAKVSPTWKSTVGSGKSVKWPTGLGGKGNEGVTGMVKATPGAIGYVELAYARQNKLPTALVRNRDGAFVAPTVASASAAAAGVTVPADLRVSITDPTGKDAYPIAALTYLLVYRDQSDASRGAALARFLTWALGDGQKLCGALDYSPLPESIAASARALVNTIAIGGKPALGAR